tara:strand:+ start:1189 stop:1530 length:342 start_codon:yes stop_codon:yes gene_type:complete
MKLDFIKKELKKINYNQIIYYTSLMLIFFVLLRLIILQEFLNVFKETIDPIKTEIQNIKDSEFFNEPLEKIKKELINSANNPLSEEDIKVISDSLSKILKESVNPVISNMNKN